MNLPDELKKLADLRRDGSLSEQEFVDAKTQLIASGSNKKTKRRTGWLLITFGVIWGLIVLNAPSVDQDASGLIGTLILPAIFVAVGCYYAGFIKKAI